MPALLHKWDTLITFSLHPSNINPHLLTDEFIHFFVGQSEIERETFQASLIEGMVFRRRIRDKQQFVQVNQAILIRLLDKLYSYQQIKEIDEKVLSMYTTISRHLESALNFIEDFFANFFERNEKIPTGYHTVSIKELTRQSEVLQQSLKEENIEPSLINIIVESFNKFCFSKKSITYNQLAYQKDLMNELRFHQTPASELTIREVLFYMNFNNDDYVDFLITKLISITEPLPTRKEKIASLRLEQKNINQLRTKLDIHLSANMPSLKEQINQWIEEEVKFLQQELTPDGPSKVEIEQEDKIQTSLSVSKLALLLKLMVLDKIITNRVIAQMLRITIKTVTTVQRENITFGSLETKYHNPDKGTISAVKDMLFRWLNILNKL